MSDSSDAMAAAVDPEHVAKQQAEYEAEQAAERQRVAEHEAANPTVATIEKFREGGGYALMDPQWVVSEGFGQSGADTNTPEARTELVRSQVLDAQWAAWEDDAGALNPLPLSPSGQQHLQGYGNDQDPASGNNGRWNEALRMGLDVALYGSGAHTVIQGWPSPASTGQ